MNFKDVSEIRDKLNASSKDQIIDTFIIIFSDLCYYKSEAYKDIKSEINSRFSKDDDCRIRLIELINLREENRKLRSDLSSAWSCTEYERTRKNMYYKQTLGRKKPNRRNQKTYLIKNLRNGLYKIGVSTKPKQRFKTLSSEEPELKLVATFNKNMERKLHNQYKDLRVRGEWFKLSKVQVEYICSSNKKFLVN